MKYTLDEVLFREGKLYIIGWATGREPGDAISYELTDKKGQPVESNY